MNYTKRFRDHELAEQWEYVDSIFLEKVQDEAMRRKVTYHQLSVFCEVKSHDSSPINDDEYKYLLIDDCIAALAFCRRTDLNNFELVLSTFNTICNNV